MAEFTKKVEILRALVRTKDQFTKEFPDVAEKMQQGQSYIPFTESSGMGSSPATTIRDIDLKIIEEFKKTFSLGFNQLMSFIQKLDEASPTGDENNEQQKNILDVYSVLYYLECLLRGPYAGALQQEGMKLPDIFNASPDIMGINAENPEQAGSSIPVFTGVTSDLPSITVGKCPSILVQLLQTGKALTQGMFNSNVGSAVATDNTLPYIDKENDLRMTQEPGDGRSGINPAHGNHMVKDREKIKLVEAAIEGIINSIKEFLGKKPYQLFLFKRGVNYFNKQINKARSANKRETRLFDYMKQRFEEEEDDCAKDGVGEEILELEETLVGADMFGQTFDSITRREFELKTQNNDGANLFKLYTVKGQLGSGDEPESDPITC
tara:strand:- start:564 stop:1703 length:1140 start_codon:yes stop_codon:yes gene_type:complete